MNLELQDRSVVVTGGSKGIGLAIALAFAAEGARPVLVSRQRTHLDAALQAFADAGHAAPRVIEMDLAVPGSAQALHALVPDADILVNNAGAIPGGNIHAVDEARWRAAWELKLYSYVNLTRAYLATMEARGHGVICNIIGMAGAAPRYDYICGAAANAALIALTRGVGAGSVARGVRVFGINPSPTRSDRIRTLFEQQAATRLGDAARWPELAARLPFGRLAEPAEIASLAVLGCSPRCGYLSGTVIDVDGGQQFAPA